MAKIKWVTPAGDLGTHPENTEFSFQLEAEDPSAPNPVLGFDPRDSITGNGVTEQVTVSMLDTKNAWNIQGLGLPGLATVGGFPSEQNPNRISASNVDVTYPYRGGLDSASLVQAPTSLGAIGYTAIGVPLFAPFINVVVPGSQGTTWTVDGVSANVTGADSWGGAPSTAGEYHYTDSRFISANAWAKIPAWKSGYRSSDGHSKIVGWAADGYPIYGPYGYASTVSRGAVVRMQSGYTLQTSINRPRPVRVQITPAKYTQTTISVSSTAGLHPGQHLRGPWPEGTIYIVSVLSAEQLQLNTAPPVEIFADTRIQAYWPAGHFVEDWEYTSPAGTTLDEHNGRFCVTPEFPAGTYAYFMTEDINQKPTYPYIIGPTYYGSLTIDSTPGIANIEAAASSLSYSLLSGALPSGLQLQSSGLLYGFPQVTDIGDTVAREYSFTIRVTNTVGQISDRTFTMAVNKIAPPIILATGVRGEGVGATLGNINLSFTNHGLGYSSSTVGASIAAPTTTGGETAIPGKIYLHANGAIKSIGLTSPGTGYVTPPAITFTGANTVTASAEITSLTTSGRENLGYFFDGDFVELQINVQEVSPTGILTWQVVQGSLPPGLSLSQTGVISGFALAPAAPGTEGTSAYDVGSYDQYVWDFEGAADSRVYSFSIRVFDGINYVDQKYKIGIYDKTFFLIDNVLITADNTLYTVDRDGYQYPSIVTTSTVLPPVRQLQNYAYQFKAYYSNPNFKVKWSVNAGGPALFDQGASPSPDDNGRYYTLVPYDNKGYDQTDLSLPSGIFIDLETGWLLGSLGTTTSAETTYEFEVTAYVEIPISQTVTSRRNSQPVRFTLSVLSDVTDLVTWATDSDLGTIDNGQISTIAVEASTSKGTALTYRIKSGQYLRVPQGLSLLSNGLLAGRTSFDFFSLDRINSEITFDKQTNTYDSKYQFTVIAESASGEVYSEKDFTVTVTNVNVRPYENLYLKALLPAPLRQVFRSIVTDERLSSDDIIYRSNDPYFGIHLDLTMLAQAGIRAETASAYIDAMANYHYDKNVNFGTIKKAVARNIDGSVKYEVLYVEVSDYNTADTAGTTISKPDRSPRELGFVTDIVYTEDDFQSVADSNTRYEDFGAITDSDIVGDNQVYSNSFANMREEIAAGIGYEYKGALPEWMLSVQPDTGTPLGFVRALVLAYAKPGQGDKLLYRYQASLLQSGYGVGDIMNTFRFVADRYQWDRQLSVNYDPTTGSFVPSVETTFDRIPSEGIVDRGTWINRDSGLSSEIWSIVYGSSRYIAVGDSSRILTSTSGASWTLENQRLDLGYKLSTIGSLETTDTSLLFAYTNRLSVGDELLQTSVYSSNARSYITSVSNSVRLSANIANAIAAGTTLECINYRDGTFVYATTSQSASAGTNELYIASTANLESGFGVYVKGIDLSNAVVVTANVGSVLTLSNVTTNLISAGTKITFDDLRGNVEILTTSAVTAAGSSNISFTSIGNVTTGYYPRITSIDLGTTILSRLTHAEVSESPITRVQAGTELEFTHRITASAAIGDGTIQVSNTEQFAVGTELFPVSIESNTNDTASWDDVSPADTKVYITLPLSGINGELIRGMRVVGPGLPTSSILTEITSNVTYANLTVGFNSTTIAAQSNVALSFLTPTTVNSGTTIIGKTDTSIILSDALTANIGLGADNTVEFGLTNVALRQVIFDGQRFIAVGDKGLIIDKAASDRVWNQRLGLVYGDLTAIGYRSYYVGTTLTYTYIAVGKEGTVIRSEDLDTWSLPIVTLANRTLNAITHYNGTWVAVGDGGQIITSTDDGLTWTLDNSTTTINLNDVVYYNQWIIVGDGGYVWTRADDSTTWTRYNVGASDSLRSIALINNIYYAVGARGTIATSLDATSWTVGDRFTTNRLNGVSKGATTPVAVGSAGVILSEANNFTVQWAVRNVAFDLFHNATLTSLALAGYRVKDGDLLIFAQQEGFGGTNDGWNLDGSVIPGFLESIASSAVSNKRAGIWQVSISLSGIVTLEFVRQILPGQVVTVTSETTKLFYDPQIKVDKTVPEYSLTSVLLPDSTQNTSFDAEGTRFSSNKDNYTEPGTLDKYLKFPKTGVFR